MVFDVKSFPGVVSPENCFEKFRFIGGPGVSPVPPIFTSSKATWCQTRIMAGRMMRKRGLAITF
jgi:hypothetical protein